MRPRLSRMVNGAFMVKGALPSREPVKSWEICAAVRDDLAPAARRNRGRGGWLLHRVPSGEGFSQAVVGAGRSTGFRPTRAYQLREASWCRAGGSGGRVNGGGRDANGCRDGSDSRTTMSAPRCFHRPGEYQSHENRRRTELQRPPVPGLRRLRKGSERHLSEALMEVNLSFRLAPRPLTTAMIASDIPAAIKPYSIAVAPDSSFKNFKIERFM